MTAQMPARIARLPRDRRGYPIPWNVLKADDGTPFFTVNDDRRHWQALRENLCPLCGDALGAWRWYVGGPISAFDPDGWYFDLPGHRDCIRYALGVCPYLAAPKYLGRIDVADPSKLPPEARLLLDNTMIPERPDVFVAVSSNRSELQPRGPLFPYTRPRRPYAEQEYWRHGKRVPFTEAQPYLWKALVEAWKRRDQHA